MSFINLYTMIFAALLAGPPERTASPRDGFSAPDPSGLIGALRSSDVAEIYLIRRTIVFPAAPRPEMLRSLGCKYLLFRRSAQWSELERALADADVRFSPAAAAAEVRVGLVLTDRLGTLWEAYADYPYADETVVPGLSQRHHVTVSASFVTALEGFARRHPDLIDGTRTQLCDINPVR